MNCNFVSISMTDANQFIIMLTTGDVHLHVTKVHLICVMTPQPSKKCYHRIWPYKGIRGLLGGWGAFIHVQHLKQGSYGVFYGHKSNQMEQWGHKG